MRAKNLNQHPDRPRNRDSLRVELSHPLPLPPDSLLPWEEELVTSILSPPLPSPPRKRAELDRHAPFGFRTALVVDDSGAIRLAPDPHEAAVVRELCRLYLTESGAHSVARTLNERGHRMRDGQPWDKGTVLAVLDSPAIGGREYQIRLSSDDDQAVPRFGRVSAPPIVDKSTIELVRHVREDRDPAATGGRPTNRPQLLKGLLLCARCGDDFQLETASKTVNGTRYRYSYYNCRSTTRDGVAVCSGRRVPTDALDRAVIELVRESVCRETRFAALTAAREYSIEEARDALAKLLTNSAAAQRIYLLHLVQLIEVFTDKLILTPRSEPRFHGEVRWIRPNCA